MCMFNQIVLTPNILFATWMAATIHVRPKRLPATTSQRSRSTWRTPKQVALVLRLPTLGLWHFLLTDVRPPMTAGEPESR